MYTCIYKYVYECMYTHTCIYVYVYMYIHICIHIYIYIHAHMYTFTHTCTYIHIYTQNTYVCIGSQIPEPLLMLTSTCPLISQVSQGVVFRSSRNSVA